jgi:hypothetical protein
MTDELEQLIRRRLNILWHLARLDAARIAAMRTTPLRELLRHARSDADLRAIALARGYRPGWVWHVKRERRATPC